MEHVPDDEDDDNPWGSPVRTWAEKWVFVAAIVALCGFVWMGTQVGKLAGSPDVGGLVAFWAAALAGAAILWVRRPRTAGLSLAGFLTVGGVIWLGGALMILAQIQAGASEWAAPLGLLLVFAGAGFGAYRMFLGR